MRVRVYYQTIDLCRLFFAQTIEMAALLPRLDSRQLMSTNSVQASPEERPVTRRGVPLAQNHTLHPDHPPPIKHKHLSHDSYYMSAAKHPTTHQVRLVCPAGKRGAASRMQPTRAGTRQRSRNHHREQAARTISFCWSRDYELYLTHGESCMCPLCHPELHNHVATRPTSSRQSLPTHIHNVNSTKGKRTSIMGMSSSFLTGSGSLLRTSSKMLPSCEMCRPHPPKCSCRPCSEAVDKHKMSFIKASESQAAEITGPTLPEIATPTVPDVPAPLTKPAHTRILSDSAILSRASCKEAVTSQRSMSCKVRSDGKRLAPPVPESGPAEHTLDRRIHGLESLVEQAHPERFGETFGKEGVIVSPVTKKQPARHSTKTKTQTSSRQGKQCSGQN